MFGIPVERLVILLKHNTHNNQFRTEVYNMAWRIAKKINEGAKLE